MECNDRNCPLHGCISVRGMTSEGFVASDKMNKTVIVQNDYTVKVKKYERYMKSRIRIAAHNPPCINAKKGDAVRIAECRRLSKTVSFVVVEKLNK